METMQVAVVGAGTMGTDVAMNIACYGHEVQLMDRDIARLEKSLEIMARNLRLAKMMKPALNDIDERAALERITLVKNMERFSFCQIVIENVAEKFEIKSEVYRHLDSYCHNDAVFCVNTSCISITKIASVLRSPGRVIGMHFMNPALLKDTVELIKGYHTFSHTLDTAKAFLKSIRKSAISVNDFPGFVANRLSHLFMNEAAFLIQDQVADPKSVDMIFKRGYGHTMGPLETADLIGLDTVVDSLDILYNSYQDTKFRCCPLLRKMVDAGLLGKKVGQGFYKY